MTFSEIRQVLDTVSFPDYAFTVGMSSGYTYLQATYAEADTVTGAVENPTDPPLGANPRDVQRRDSTDSLQVCTNQHGAQDPRVVSVQGSGYFRASL